MQELELQRFKTEISVHFFTIAINKNLDIVAHYLRNLSHILLHLYRFPHYVPFQAIELKENSFFKSSHDPVFFVNDKLLILSDIGIHVHEYNQINSKFELKAEIFLPFKSAMILHPFIYQQELLVNIITTEFISLYIYYNWRSHFGGVFYTGVLPSDIKFQYPKIEKINEIYQNNIEPELSKNWQYLVLKVKNILFHSNHLFINQSRILTIDTITYYIKCFQLPTKILRKHVSIILKDFIICKNGLIISLTINDDLRLYSFKMGKELEVKIPNYLEHNIMGAQFSEFQNRLVCWDSEKIFYQICPLIHEQEKLWRQL